MAFYLREQRQRDIFIYIYIGVDMLVVFLGSWTWQCIWWWWCCLNILNWKLSSPTIYYPGVDWLDLWVPSQFSIRYPNEKTKQEETLSSREQRLSPISFLSLSLSLSLSLRASLRPFCFSWGNPHGKSLTWGRPEVSIPALPITSHHLHSSSARLLLTRPFKSVQTNTMIYYSR